MIITGHATALDPAFRVALVVGCEENTGNCADLFDRRFGVVGVCGHLQDVLVQMSGKQARHTQQAKA